MPYPPMVLGLGGGQREDRDPVALVRCTLILSFQVPEQTLMDSQSKSKSKNKQTPQNKTKQKKTKKPTGTWNDDILKLSELMPLKKIRRLRGWMTAWFEIIHHWSGRLLGREWLLDGEVHWSLGTSETADSVPDSPTLQGMKLPGAPSHRKASSVFRTPMSWPCQCLWQGSLCWMQRHSKTAHCLAYQQPLLPKILIRNVPYP